MLLRMVFSLCLFCLGLSLEAQGADSTRRRSTGLPFVTAPMTSGAQYAQIIETGQAVGGVRLYVSPDSVLLAWKASFPDLGIETRQSLAAHIRTLKVVDCPNVSTTLAWVRDGNIRLTGWRRTLGAAPHLGEKCLLNEEKGRYEASLACGNIIPRLPVASQSAAVATNRRDTTSSRRDTTVRPAQDSSGRAAGANAQAVTPTGASSATAQASAQATSAGPTIPPPAGVSTATTQQTVTRPAPNTGAPRVSRERSRASRWILGTALVVAGASICEHNSQKWGSRPGQFRCFVRETNINIRVNSGG